MQPYCFLLIQYTIVSGVILRINIRIRGSMGETFPKLPLQRRVSAWCPWSFHDPRMVKHEPGPHRVGQVEAVAWLVTHCTHWHLCSSVEAGMEIAEVSREMDTLNLLIDLWICGSGNGNLNLSCWSVYKSNLCNMGEKFSGNKTVLWLWLPI